MTIQSTCDLEHRLCTLWHNSYYAYARCNSTDDWQGRPKQTQQKLPLSYQLLQSNHKYSLMSMVKIFLLINGNLWWGVGYIAQQTKSLFHDYNSLPRYQRDACKLGSLAARIPQRCGEPFDESSYNGNSACKSVGHYTTVIDHFAAMDISLLLQIWWVTCFVWKTIYFLNIERETLKQKCLTFQHSYTVQWSSTWFDGQVITELQYFMDNTLLVFEDKSAC